MDVVIVEDQEALGSVAASLVIDALDADPGLVLGVATGSSPVTTYRALAPCACRAAGTSRGVRCVALDEYRGIAEADPASYHSFIRREIAVPLGIPVEHLLVPDGAAEDPDAACRAFEDAVRRLGGVDLQILGIGRNGHLGFNEPGSPFASRTRVARLSETTRADNARFFARPEDVPTQCLTQGLGTILEARTGGARGVGARTRPRPSRRPSRVPSRRPARLRSSNATPHATVVVDRAAAAGLGPSGDAMPPRGLVTLTR